MNICTHSAPLLSVSSALNLSAKLQSDSCTLNCPLCNLSALAATGQLSCSLSARLPRSQSAQKCQAKVNTFQPRWTFQPSFCLLDCPSACCWLLCCFHCILYCCLLTVFLLLFDCPSTLLPFPSSLDCHALLPFLYCPWLHFIALWLPLCPSSTALQDCADASGASEVCY